MTNTSIDHLETLNPDELGELLRNAVDVDKNPPDFQFIKNIITVGGPIDAVGKYGITALHIAAGIGYPKMVKLLISLGADINARDDYGRTALHVAARRGDIEVVKFLVSQGADIKITNNYGNIALDVSSPLIREKVPELKPK